jgi:23S rRNA (cytidine2498-2'-O)-methyltransferase
VENLFLSESENVALVTAELQHLGYQTEVRAPQLVASNAAGPNGFNSCFCAQLIPDFEEINAQSIREWAEVIFNQLCEKLSEGERWQLHIYDIQTPDTQKIGQRARFISEQIQTLLQKKRRGLKKNLILPVDGSMLKTTEDFVAAYTKVPPLSTAALYQLLLLSSTHGIASFVPGSKRLQFGSALSGFPAGVLSIPENKALPSRAYRKLLEAQARFGNWIEAQQSCVDLGACPGGWSSVALSQGARVMAIDRSPLDPVLMQHPKLSFERGDAFAFIPPRPVDWMICDVIAYPERTFELVQKWHQKALCKKSIVTFKFKGQPDLKLLNDVRQYMRGTGHPFMLRQLASNKNEVMLCVDWTAREIFPQ